MANANKSNITKRSSLSRPLTVSEGDTNFDELINVIEDVNLRSKIQDVTTTVSIPTDYPTLQSAIDDLSTLSVASGVVFDLLIEAGHQPASGVLVENGDFGHFQISSVDSEVTVSGNFSIIAVNARAPILNCLINLSASTEFDSYKLSKVASGLITAGSGMKNGQRGLHAEDASTCSADSCIFTGFQQAGIHCSRNSVVQCSYADLSNNSIDPNNNFGTLYSSRASRIHGADINATNSGGNAVRAQRYSVQSIPGIDVSGAADIAVVAASGARIYSATSSLTGLNLQGQAASAGSGASLTLPGATFSSATGFSGTAIEVRSASNCDLNQMSISGFTGLVLYGLESSIINARDCVINGGSTAIRSEQGATINARGTQVTNQTANGVIADNGATLIISDGSVTGSVGDDLVIISGSWMVAENTTTTNGTGSPNVIDTNLTGGFNFSDNGKRGFIWA